VLYKSVVYEGDRLKWWRFVFGKCLVRISSKTPTVLTDVVVVLLTTSS